MILLSNMNLVCNPFSIVSCIHALITPTPPIATQVACHNFDSDPPLSRVDEGCNMHHARRVLGYKDVIYLPTTLRNDGVRWTDQKFGCTVVDKQSQPIWYLVIGIFWQQTDFRFGFSLSKYIRKHTSEIFPTTF